VIIGRVSRATIRASVLLIAGVVLSGPLALLVVALVHPQPSWRDAATFAAAYHPVQLLPYVGGFALIGGFVALIVIWQSELQSTRAAGEIDSFVAKLSQAVHEGIAPPLDDRQPPRRAV